MHNQQQRPRLIDQVADTGADDTLTAAAAGLTAGDVVGIDAAEADAVERGLYCPATVPCLGRPGVLVQIPVRRQSDRAQVGELQAPYCPRCRTFGESTIRRPR